MADVDLSLPLLLDEAKASAVRLKEAWPWLGEMLEPGRTTPVQRSQDLRDIERDWAEHQKDRLAAFASTQAGIVPSGPHPSVMRNGAASARTQIALALRDTAEALWRSVNPGTTIDLLVIIIDPTRRAIRTRCGGCGGDGWTLDDKGHLDLPCDRCEGRGTVRTGAVCAACQSKNTCPCDLADALVGNALVLIADQLPRVTDPDVAAEAQRTLGRADEHARNVANVGEDKRSIKAPCPACGRRGCLVAEVSARRKDGTRSGAPDMARWKVTCEYPGCACRGSGCSCGRPVRGPGMKHVWPASEWDGPNGLAKRLGVDLPGTERHAVKPEPMPEPEVALAVAA